MIKEKITIYYDQECPFCNSYVGYLKLKDSYELILKNVREDKNIDSKFDINNGFIVNFKDNFFQGSKALEFLNSVVNKDTFLGKLHFFFKYDNLFSNFLSHLQIAINNPQFKLNQIQKKPFEIV